MDFAQSLYYSPMHGRFTSPDEFKGGPDELFDFEEDAADNPTFYADLSNPQSLNKYQYGYNNPYKYNDPSGHCPPCLAWAVFEVVSAAADVVVAVQTVRDPNASRAEKIGTVLGAAASITLPGGGYGIGAKVVIKALRREATETVVKKTAPAVAKNTVTKAPRIPKSERVGPVPKKLRKQKFDENRQANKGKLKCDYCGSDMAPAKKSQKGVTPPKNEATLDHVVPRSRGGSNNPPNLKPACRKCNGEKSDND
ncbi:MAG: HNH endonuclease [Acidobacteriota bacterium]